jgi:hypothetical protein
VWDACSVAEVHRLEGHTDRVTTISFSPNGQRFASASKDRTVRVWDAYSVQRGGAVAVYIERPRIAHALAARCLGKLTRAQIVERGLDAAEPVEDPGFGGGDIGHKQSPGTAAGSSPLSGAKPVYRVHTIDMLCLILICAANRYSHGRTFRVATPLTVQSVIGLLAAASGTILQVWRSAPTVRRRDSCAVGCSRRSRTAVSFGTGVWEAWT